jgi:hypothetical protein
VVRVKTLIVAHTHYDTAGLTRAYGPFYDADEAERVRAHLAELTSDVYGTGDWRVMPLASIAVGED